MSTLSIRLPEFLHQQLKVLAKQDGVSMNQFIACAVSEKMAALNTEQYLHQRAEVGNQADFLAAMQKVPDVLPEHEEDKYTDKLN